MSPSFNSFGSNPSVSQLVWDTDLVIPAGKAIESASGEVGVVGDVSVSGSLSGGSITATNADFENLTVDGYTPKLIQSTGNVISYNGNPNTTVICATVPSGGVMCNGNATVEIFTTGTTTIRVYARCSSFGGKISDVLLGSLSNPKTESFTVSFANAKIPESTQLIGFYATGDYSPKVTNINITSASYTSKQLI